MDSFSRLPKNKQLFQINHIGTTIDFICKSSGLGITNFVEPDEKLVLETGVYTTEVSVFNRDAFKNIFIELMRPFSLKEKGITISFC